MLEDCLRTDEMVGAALFLASGACSFLTGETLFLSSGYQDGQFCLSRCTKSLTKEGATATLTVCIFNSEFREVSPG